MKDITGGYWGLMIILSAFMIQFIAFGIALSIGVYNIEFLAFTDDAFSVSLVSAINTGVFLGSGPLASLMMNHMSHRRVVLIGAALSFSAVLSMPFLPSIQYMYVIFGIVAGLGFCLVYVPSHVMSGLYFDKHQTLATAVATAGSGLGMTVFPVLAAYIIEVYTWRPSFLIMAGIALNLFVFALLLRPLPKRPLKKTDGEDETMLKKNDGEDETMLKKTDGEDETMLKKTDGEDETMLDSSQQTPKVFKNFYVFCDFNFDIYFFSNVLWNMGLNIVIMFGPDYLTTIGLSKLNAAFMLTVLGFSTFLGSLLTGFVGNLPFVNRIYLYQFACTVSGISVVCLVFVRAYAAMVAVHVFLGLGFGGILGLLIVIIADLLGPESLGNGVGYIMLANGIGCFAGPTLAGVLKNSLGNYEVAIYTGSALVLFSGAVMSAIPIKEIIYGKAVLHSSEKIVDVDDKSF